MLANFAHALGGRVAYLFSQWAILIALARLGNAEVVGDFGLAMAITAPLVMFGQLGMRDLFSTDPDEEKFREYFGVRIISVILLFAVSFIVALVADYPTSFRIVLFGVCAAKAIESLSDMMQGVMQRYERLDIVGKSLAIRGLLMIAIGVVAMYQTRSLGQTVCAYAVAWAVLLWLYDMPAAKRLLSDGRWFTPSLALGRTTTLVMMALPLGGVGLLTSMNTNIGRYFLEAFSDRATLGHFTVIAASLSALDIINIALGKSVIARLANTYHTSRDHFLPLVYRLCLMGTAVGICGLAVGVLFGEQLLTVVFGAEYGEHRMVLVIMILGRVATITGTYVKAAQVVVRQLRFQFIASLVGLLFGAAAGFWLVPRYGIIGAAGTVTIIQWSAFALGAVALSLALNRSSLDNTAIAFRVPQS